MEKRLSKEPPKKEDTKHVRKVCVIGLGYIGLPTALIMAANGVEVVGVDRSKELVDTLNAGKTTFEEKGLDELFEKAVQSGIRFSSEYESANMYIVAVPTPYLAESKQIDPRYVAAAVKDVLSVCEENTILVIESTVSPGTMEKHVRPIVKKAKRTVHLVHAPERILPGNMIHELSFNARTIGADEQAVAEEVRQVYASFCRADIILTDIQTAEMTKVIENTYRDINIAFANELTRICHSTGMNVYEVIRIANMHPRVNILQPGPGVGGHCISVDPWFLVGDYPDLTNLILTARKTNDDMPEYVLKRIREIAAENQIDDLKRIGLYGLTYKEDVDDTRESPTLQLLEKLKSHMAVGIKVYDPFIQTKTMAHQYLDFDEFLAEIDMLVIMVAHTHLKDNTEKIRDKIIFDTRNTVKLPGAYRL